MLMKPTLTKNDVISALKLDTRQSPFSLEDTIETLIVTK